MTAIELIRKQCDEVGSQLSRVFEGVLEVDVDTQPLPHMMSIRQQTEHLCECYVALKTTAQGGKHEWGTFAAETESWTDLRALFDALRQDAIETALASERGLDLLSDFVVAHDNYHVGQLVLARTAVLPEWDPYAIYGM